MTSDGQLRHGNAPGARRRDAGVTGRRRMGTHNVVSVAKATGEEMTMTGRLVDVSRRIDGRWQYVVDHPSDDAAPAAVDAATALAE